jgi:hypothetical protein
VTPPEWRAAAPRAYNVAMSDLRVRVSEPTHLCRVQAATRDLCRSIGLKESDVFAAVIAVTELAHRHFIEGARPGDLGLAVVRRRGGSRLEVRTEDGPEGRVAPRLVFAASRGIS